MSTASAAAAPPPLTATVYVSTSPGRPSAASPDATDSAPAAVTPSSATRHPAPPPTAAIDTVGASFTAATVTVSVAGVMSTFPLPAFPRSLTDTRTVDTP